MSRFPTGPTLERVLAQVQNEARKVKSEARALKERSLAGPISAIDIITFFEYLGVARLRFIAAQSVPGLGQYARDQLSNQSIDVVAEFTAMLTQITATIAWVQANFPASGGYILREQLNLDGTVTTRSFSTAVLATFRTQLDLLIGTIE